MDALRQMRIFNGIRNLRSEFTVTNKGNMYARIQQAKLTSNLNCEERVLLWI